MPSGIAPQITSTNSLTGQVGAAVSYAVTASGTAPISFSATNLPANLAINATNGLISGVPTTAGSGMATITAVNAFGTNSASLPWTIAPRTLLSITGASVTGRAYDGTRSATVDWDNHVLSGVSSSHAVELVTSNAVAQFGDANAGTNKTVSVTGLSLAGADAGRYELGPVLLLAGTIEPRTLVVEGLAVVTRRYNGETNVVAPLDWSGHGLGNRAPGEGSNEVSVSAPYVDGKYSSLFAESPNGRVGSNKPVTGWNGTVVLGGSRKDNYKVARPTNLFGTVLKGWVEIAITDTNQVYGRTNRVVTTTLNVAGVGARTNYWGTHGTVYGPSSNGPVRAGWYGVEVVVEDNSQTYEGTNTGVLRIAPLGVRVAAHSDTIVQGGSFNAQGYRLVRGSLLGDDTLGGGLTTHLRSQTNTNPLVPYVGTNSARGTYRVLQGTVGSNPDYVVEGYTEGVLTVLGDSVVTEGTVVPLGMGQGFTAVVLTNGAVTNWGTNTLGALPAVLHPTNIGTTNFVGARGLGAGGGAGFALAWMNNGSGVVWGTTNFSVGATPRGVAAMVGLSPTATNPWVAVMRDGGTQETVPGTVPDGRITNVRVVAMAAGTEHGLSVRADGTVTAWGQDPFSDGKRLVPAGLTNAVAVAAGRAHSVVLRKDGTVVAWGGSGNNATSVPAELASTNHASFVRVVALASADSHNLALRADGSLRWWGPTGHILNPGHASNAALGLENPANPVVAVGVSATPHAAAVRRNGQVVVWGNASASITNVNSALRAMVPMGGADSDRDGWANEAEMRVGTDPLSTNSTPVKASFGITFNYGRLPSLFQMDRELTEGTNQTVGAVEILDSMGRREDGNQKDMQISLAEDNRELFELEMAGTNRTLRFKSAPVHSAGSPQPDVHQVKVIVRDGELTAETVSTLEVRVANRLPTLTVPATLTVPENQAAGSPVGTPLGADEDIVAWRIVAGQGANYFQIGQASGQLSVKEPADYEALPANNKTLTFTVEATDRAGATVERLVAVQISDVEENSLGGWLELGGITLLPGEPVPAPLLTKYAIGGAASPSEPSVPPALTVQTNGSGQPTLSLTALVRIDDNSLAVQAEVSSDLGAWSSSGVTTTAAPNQDGVPQGFQKRVYTVPADATRRFIRLKVTR